VPFIRLEHTARKQVAAVLAHCELQGVQSAARQRVTALTAYTQSQRQRAPELTVTLDIAAPLLVLPDAPADLQHCRLLLIDLGHIGLVRHRSGAAAAATDGIAAAGSATAAAGDSTDNSTVTASSCNADDVTESVDAVSSDASGSSASTSCNYSSGDKWSLSVHGAHAAVVLDAAAYVNAEEQHDADIAAAETDDTEHRSAAADNRELLLKPFDVTFEVRGNSYLRLVS
jgi:hypothetical protein